MPDAEPLLRVQSDPWTVELLPHVGGSIANLQHAGRAVLRSTPEDAIAQRAVRRTACYPLVPYSNRIARGRFVYDGVVRQLRPNFDNNLHAIHGVGWISPWTVEHADTRSAILALRHRPNGEAAQFWPYAFDAWQTVAIADERLSLTLKVTNVDASAMPAGIGIHPYFTRRAGTTLAFASDGAWLRGADFLPSERVHAPAWDYRHGRRIEERQIDNDFFGWRGSVRIRDPDLGVSLTMRADPVFGHLVVFTPGDRDYFAVEPVSHMTDAVNRPHEADHGLVTLQPGEAMSGSIVFEVESL